jgi:hypothetical protein
MNMDLPWIVDQVASVQQSQTEFMHILELIASDPSGTWGERHEHASTDSLDEQALRLPACYFNNQTAPSKYGLCDLVLARVRVHLQIHERACHVCTSGTKIFRQQRHGK